MIAFPFYFHNVVPLLVVVHPPSRIVSHPKDRSFPDPPRRSLELDRGRILIFLVFYVFILISSHENFDSCHVNCIVSFVLILFFTSKIVIIFLTFQVHKIVSCLKLPCIQKPFV
jgi:hypothetical protein